MTARAVASGNSGRLPLWFELLAGGLTTGIMSGAVSGVSTARTYGWDSILASPFQWLADWGRAFVLAWPLAFLIFWFVAPRVRRQLEKLARRL